MREIKKYQAIDGTMWDSEEECLYHEKQDVEEMYEWAMKIRTYCRDKVNCTNCLFNTGRESYWCALDNGVPKDWEVDEFESDE